MATNILCKIYTLLGLTQLVSLIVDTRQLGADEKTWSYELKSVTTKSSHPEILNFNLEITRVSRGVFAISGEMLNNLDIAEGDSNNIAVKLFRSVRGDDDYKVLPLQVPEGHFYKILNTYYKDVIMDTLKDCSDMPVFEDQFQPPLEKKTFIFDACQFSQDGLPNHMQEGLYKMSIIGTGEVEWQIDIFAEIIPNL